MSFAPSSWLRGVLALTLFAVAGLACAAPPAVPWAKNAPRAKVVAPAAANAKAFANDPTGDAFGTSGVNHDITSISADVANNALLITINFANQISPPNSGRPDAVVGYVDIDTDGNTAETDSNLDGFCPSSQSPVIGTDFFLFLFSGSTSSAPVYSADGGSAGNATTAYGSNTLTISIPLTTIAAGAAPIKVATVLGNVNVPTDCAPNGAALVAASATAGPPVQASGTMQAGSTITFHSPVNGVRYDWDFDADGVIDRTGTSSSLPVTYPGAYSGNVSVLTTDANGNRTISNMTINTAAPKLTTSLVGTSGTIVCGDGDNALEPGETVQFPIRITNTGNATSGVDGAVLLTPDDRVAASGSGTSIDGKMIVQTPLITVGALAPGASMDANVLVTFAQSASFGGTYGVIASGGLDGASSNTGSSTPFATLTTASTGQVYTGSCSALAADKALVTPRQGLYYNVNRSGNGLSNFVIPVAGGSPIFFGAWFTGAADHTPTWYVVQGSLVGNTVVAPVYRFTRNLGSSSFAVNSAVVGQAVVTLKSAEQMAFFWQIGTKSGIELMNYLTPGAAAAPNRTGAWYNTNESGWGEVVHAFSSGGQNTVFTVDYLYDAAGEPRWVLAQATETALAGGSGHATYQVHCPGCPWIGDWNSFPLSTGTGSEQFFNATTGQTTTNFAFPVPLAGSWVRSNLPLSLLTVPQ